VANTRGLFRNGGVGFIDWLGQLGLSNLIWTYNRSSPHAEQPEAFAASVKVFVRSNEHVATIMKVAPHHQDITFGIKPTQPLLRPDGMFRAIDFKRHRRKQYLMNRAFLGKKFVSMYNAVVGKAETDIHRWPKKNRFAKAQGSDPCAEMVKMLQWCPRSLVLALRSSYGWNLDDHSSLAMLFD
jgi:hypothetical protein